MSVAIRCSSTLTIYKLASLDQKSVRWAPKSFIGARPSLSVRSVGGAITVAYDGSQYPIDVPNHGELSAESGRIVRGFRDIDVAVGQSIYSFDEEAQLYVPQEKKVNTDLCLGVSDLILEANKKPEILYAIDSRKFEELIAHIFPCADFRLN